MDKGYRVQPLTFRVNPEKYPEHKKFLEIVKELRERRFTISEIIVDAVLRANGVTPEMFPKKEGESVATILQTELMSEMCQMLIQMLKEQGLLVSGSSAAGQRENPVDVESTTFTRNFAKGFLARRAQAQGDDDEE